MRRALMAVAVVVLALRIVDGGARAAGQQRDATAPRPNILFILSDDQGWADVGWHAAEIKTPSLDRLAAAGARLEQFYVLPVCSPTRAALMTGRYPMRYGLQTDVIRPWAQYGLPLEERTLAQALREAGYTTAICGKWHLGAHQRAYLPTQRGFDHQYGHYCGAIDYFQHTRDGGFDWHRDDRVSRDEGYSTFLLAREAVGLIQKQPKDKPLFLYVAFNAVHAPHQVPPKYKEPYAHLQEPRRTYAGMVAAMDEAIGRILAALDEKGLRQNTLIIFSSDNGGPNPGRVTSNGPLRAGKATLYEGGVRVCACAAWDGHIRPGTVVNQPIHVVDWYPTLLKLAGASLDQRLPLDGRDAWPTITEGKPSPHAEILLNTEAHRGAIRVGGWKLVLGRRGAKAQPDGSTPAKAMGKKAKGKKAKQPSQGETIELFNLADDLGEKNNLASANPERVRELRARYDELARQAAPPKNQPPQPGFQSPKVWGETE
jgi:arylsulfatase A-like enzyme